MTDMDYKIELTTLKTCAKFFKMHHLWHSPFKVLS